MESFKRNKIHKTDMSHDVILAKHTLSTGIVVTYKFTYEAYNAAEKYEGMLFTGKKWNHILTMLDLGEEPQSKAYNILTSEERENRANALYGKAVAFIKMLD